MSLKIYTNKEEIPSGMRFVDYNDIFFDFYLLEDNEITCKVLKEIDKAEYSGPLAVKNRDDDLMGTECLSTGSKTLLNVIYNPDVCFDVVCCGQNALRLLHLIKNGNILWDTPVLFMLGEDKGCDIEIDGKHFSSFHAFIHYIMDERA